MVRSATGSISAIDEPRAEPQPVALAGGRIVSLDFVRGIAVMGILAANIIAFGQPFTAYMYPDAFAIPQGAAADRMWVAQFLLIDGKLRGLFTLLFGAGMVLFMDKAWAKGASRWLMARRLFWLALFGLAHFFLLWRGDILFLYAAVGFIAMACLRWPAESQLRVGLLGYFAGAIFYLIAMGFPYAVAETGLGAQAEFVEAHAAMAQAKAAELADGRAEIAIVGNGSYGDFVRHSWEKHRTQPFVMLFAFAFETLPLMLIGMGLFRMGVLNGHGDRAKLRRWGWIGVIAGTALTVPIALWAYSGGLTYWGTLAAFSALSPLPRLPVIIGAAALLALWGTGASGWLAERVSAAGRAAFSNYLGTSLVMVIVFHGWAGGLYGELGRGALYLVMLGAWVLMLAWSKPWLERFYYGPLEWLWRCLTYGRRFPLRR